jgi:hypothetical protein
MMSRIGIGEDADQLALFAAVVRDGDTGNPVLVHQLQGLADAMRGRERDWIHDHAALGSLHAVHFGRLLLDRQVLVNDAKATVLCHGDRHLRLGDRVHCGAQEWNVQRDVAGQSRSHVNLCRKHGRMLRHEQDVVEGQRGAERRGEGRGGFFEELRGGHCKL